MENKLELKNNSITRIAKGSLLAIIITLILLFIYSSLLSFTNLSESTIMPVVIGISSISILIGSLISCLKIKKRGIINGMLVGLIYIICIYLISSIVLMKFSLNISSIIMLIIGMIMGIIGGIIGVNLKR